MDTQTRNRPTLEVNTSYEYESPDGLPRTNAFRAHQTPMSAPSPLSVKPLLSPLAPIAEQAIVTRVGLMSMDSPMLQMAPPGTPTAQGARNRSMAEQTRSMLLSGMTPSQANDVETVANRRLSAPADMLQKQRRHSILLIQPDKLQDYGHVYLGNPTKADVFVAPSALRRQSEVCIKSEGVEENRVDIRARVRPRSKGRRPFVISRNFDLDQLRTTIPSPNMSPFWRQQSVAPLSPGDVSASARTPTSPLVESPLAARGARRSSMAASVLRAGHGQQLRPGSRELPIRKSLTPLPPPLPLLLAREKANLGVDIAYARSYLPALAAIMLSGHIKTGDSIDLPMPYPEVWAQTLTYVYTGEGEVTEPIRHNILHLGGQV